LQNTPGIGAVGEKHQDLTAEFLQLYSQLRERHDRDTRRLAYMADALIYVVGLVAAGTDEKFLQELEFLPKVIRTTGGRSSPLNAIGVLSKIELQPEVLAHRHELSVKITSQLREAKHSYPRCNRSPSGTGPIAGG
jgi:hypothetical protein